jgi:hypothetical protein
MRCIYIYTQGIMGIHNNGYNFLFFVMRIGNVGFTIWWVVIMIVIYEYDISTNMDGYSSAFLDYNIYI